MKNLVMRCDEIRELMPDLASGMSAVTPEINRHIQSCTECADMLTQFQQTMAVLDEWEAPEPSPYFDVRMQARLREERARQPAGWLQWSRKPALAVSFAIVLVVTVSFWRADSGRKTGNQIANVAAEPGTAVGDLQALDKNHDLYADSDDDVLDDLQVQSSVTANP
jgi:predicted anti-sigma-YlaC factor YlaD